MQFMFLNIFLENFNLLVGSVISEGSVLSEGSVIPFDVVARIFDSQ